MKVFIEVELTCDTSVARDDRVLKDDVPEQLQDEISNIAIDGWSVDSVSAAEKPEVLGLQKIRAPRRRK